MAAEEPCVRRLPPPKPNLPPQIQPTPAPVPVASSPTSVLDRRPSGPGAEGLASSPGRPVPPRSSPPRPAPTPSPPPPPGQERRIYGLAACQSLFEQRPETLRRVWLTTAVSSRPGIGALLKACASAKVPYHLTDSDELERVSSSSHHEGICMSVWVPPAPRLSDWLGQQKAALPEVLLFLEGVSNPHNLGAILRTCAHFGVRSILVPDDKLLASGAVARTAEGGLEHVEVVSTGPVLSALLSLSKAGYTLVTTSSHKGESIYTARLPQRLVLLLGAEDVGLSRGVLESGAVCLRIPGTGHVESLNVSVAVGVLLGELWRRHLDRR